MEKKYIPYVFLSVIFSIIWLLKMDYGSMVIYAIYAPCFIFVVELWGKAKLTKNLFITSFIVMVFAVIAQIIGLDTVWKLPAQHFIFNDWVLFPIEELLYWHSSMCLAVLIYKHLEVYHHDMARNFNIWINRFFDGRVFLKTYKIEIDVQATEEYARLVITSTIFSVYMFAIENYSIMNGFFEYYDNQITFYVWNVPFEGILMYICVPFFFHVLWSYIKKIRLIMWKTI